MKVPPAVSKSWQSQAIASLSTLPPQLLSIIFILMILSRQPNWTSKQLILDIDQPTQFLKEIPNESSVYNKSGVNQGTYVEVRV
ncbi:hypothetical protein DM860_013322 [Cuscuta australis]|uniref:TFIIF beta subunit HTH domain-containing protein n=1 Tax=Cuscuta australis TaxID=267555 RepID=A0A328DNU6_9ASTE|nr:hypothetical protein DM860_013322 [Cuscuta australis]